MEFFRMARKWKYEIPCWFTHVFLHWLEGITDNIFSVTEIRLLFFICVQVENHLLCHDVHIQKVFRFRSILELSLESIAARFVLKKKHWFDLLLFTNSIKARPGRPWHEKAEAEKVAVEIFHYNEVFTHRLPEDAFGQGLWCFWEADLESGALQCQGKSQTYNSAQRVIYPATQDECIFLWEMLFSPPPTFHFPFWITGMGSTECRNTAKYILHFSCETLVV